MTDPVPVPSVLIYVQHLLGIGHLARIGRVAEALAVSGMRVVMAQGGPDAGLRSPTGVEVRQLAPVKVTPADMSTLLHMDGTPFTEADRTTRRDVLLALLAEVSPDILIVEAFPFGRRQMRFELLPLLEAARDSGVVIIASSIRDILQETRKPGREEETVALIQRWFDLVLVHGEEALTPLERTFPLASSIATKVRYTGLVGPPCPAVAPHRAGVVVSAGGGVVGHALLAAAIGSAASGPCAAEPWLVLTGPNLPPEARVELEALAQESPVAIELWTSVPDLAERLACARLSISQAGYNTVADVLATDCAAVLCPYAAGGETEQASRAEALEAAGRVAVVAEAELTPERLAVAMAQALALPWAAPLALDGAARTAALLLAASSDMKAIARKS